jgi:hypothetical protein
MTSFDEDPLRRRYAALKAERDWSVRKSLLVVVGLSAAIWGALWLLVSVAATSCRMTGGVR